ncbi:orotidine-5'-phosphate decarboxylase [Tepidibacillus marianensis]|uniref:orotidine-5'-phosphate decarboxylase n=1 Tax=Tepidibacillus marianensis TaxID=3131995 RepID=UPI0030D48D69
MSIDSSMNSASIRDRMIVALDIKGMKEALELVAKLEQQVTYVKIGMELFYGVGYPIIEQLKKQGLKVFLDLKIHDIPNTAGRAAAQLTKMNVDMFNVHVAGGARMMETVREEMEKNLSTGQQQPLLIGVTQLTSTDENTLANEIGIPYSMKQVVRQYAELAQKSGLDGVVSSALDVKEIKEATGDAFITVTPGIRLAQGVVHDQKRITTPEEAICLGTDYMVIGRTITEAKEPAKVFQEIAQNIENQIIAK